MAYITVMDYSTQTITQIACEQEGKDMTNEVVEPILENLGYHLSEISYMTTDEEPDFGHIELNDILNEEAEETTDN